MFCKAFANASVDNGILQLTVDQGFLTAGKGNTNHILLRINLKRNITEEAPVLSGMRVSMDGTTDCNDISSLKVYATQSPYLNGDIKSYSYLLAESKITESGKTGSFDIAFSSEYTPLNELNYLWLTADISHSAKAGNQIDVRCDGILCKEGAFMPIESGNPEGIACIYERQAMLFNPWDNGSEFYRIPAMIVMESEQYKGRILTVTDRHFNSNADLPNRIDLVARYSDDNGASWSKAKTIAGNHSQGPDCGYGDCIKVYQTSSNDGGKTWEKPHEISDLIYDAIYKDAPSKLQGVFVTSGKGLCLKHQKRKSANGRILFVLVCKFTSGPYCNYIVYSDDEGKTWNVSKETAFVGGDEAKLVEEHNGTVIMSTRRKGERGLFRRYISAHNP